MKEHMVNILEVLDHIRIFQIKEIFSELNFEVNTVSLYETQTQIFTEFINRFGIINSLTDELKEVALPDSEAVLIYFKNEFSLTNMLYTFEIATYYSVEIDEDGKYTVIAVELIPIIDASTPLA